MMLVAACCAARLAIGGCGAGPLSSMLMACMS